MKGDFTRDTFRPRRRYDGVFMQQGRVQLDADWNEQVEITRHLRETTAADVIGGCGAPSGNAGFGLSVAGGELRISAGRFYAEPVKLVLACPRRHCSRASRRRARRRSP